MSPASADPNAVTVALLAEGVGRNGGPIPQILLPQMSPSIRRVWVEMTRPQGCIVLCVRPFLREGTEILCIFRPVCYNRG